MDSMFYVKTKVSNECEINTAISCDNVYARCGKCGAEILVNLTGWTDFIKENGIDCFGCNIYCEECSQRPEKSYIVDVILEQKDDVALVQVAIDYGFDDVCEIVSKLVDECGWDNVKPFCNKKDRLEIYYALKSKGILPLIEQEKSA